MVTKECLVWLLLASFSGAITSCSPSADDIPAKKLFTTMPSGVTGVDFQNKILEDEQLHYYRYLYIYLGGGVAVADFDNDGLEDLFFTSNIYYNRLFRNKGNFQFDNITIKAGIDKRVGFDTGVSIADVNNDGFADIYLCRAGWFDDKQKLANMLYINNGDLTFTEKAEAYGLADTGRSISATFFDYDRDNDLDLFIANAPADFSLSGQIHDLKKISTHAGTTRFLGSDKLYRNEGDGRFTDVSLAAGILPEVGFGLNAQVGDLNNDGWLDIYVSNDFIWPDFAYLNNGNGTFTDARDQLFRHISYYSMGSDIADINNDGLDDLVVLDMSPEDHFRSKTTMAMMPIDRFNTMVANKYHYQYMHNVLQLNNGNGTYSEIGNLSGIAKTDWSWSALFADFDLDGYNDIYVTNGVYRDVVDRDVNNKINASIRNNKSSLTKADYFKFTQMLPQQKLTNYLFRNTGDLRFENTTSQWADEHPTFSNGAAYADLDNDGDLDIVVNNLEEEATILRNNAVELLDHNFLQLRFSGPEQNRLGAGVKVKVYLEDDQIQTRQLIPSRGYLSSSTGKLHFGLGKNKAVKKIEIMWPDGKMQTLKSAPVNKLITVNYHDAINPITESKSVSGVMFKKIETDYFHRDPNFDDFKKQLLLPHKLSQTGPALAVSDVNNDGLSDIFIGGGYLQPGQLLLGQATDKFKTLTIPDFVTDKHYEDVDAVFFDADQDGDQDLYVVSGSYEFYAGSENLQDRLYLNNGTGRFTKSTGVLPDITTAGSVVAPSDYDNDGDIDLFVGGRVIPGKYPRPPLSYLLINDGNKFTINTTQAARELERIGMVTDAVWDDIDKDGDPDLVVVGEWMGVEVLINDRGLLARTPLYQDLSATVGWWNTILIEDIDGDGDKDIIAGNLGLNYKIKASEHKPLQVYSSDYDENGTEDIFLVKNYNNKEVPVRGKECSTQQMPFLKEKFKNYADFAKADIGAVLGDGIAASLHYSVNEFRSGIFVNSGEGNFSFDPFPSAVQLSPINSILFYDFDQDGHEDLLLAGNNYLTEVETTRLDAGNGAFLKGNGEGAFKYISNPETGFFASRDVRNMVVVRFADGEAVFVVNNNDHHELFKVVR